MNFDDIELDDIIDDPFERREVKRALEEFACGGGTDEERNVLMQCASELMETGNRDVSKLLAVLGHPTAVMRELFGA